ncbi:MAG: hypothetical protein GY754_42275 [bacterium]|nr:hypothetical protein [bacterium]
MKKRLSTIFLLIFALILTIEFTGCTTIYQYMKEKRNKTYKEGVTLYNQGKYEEANDRFDTVVSIDPEYKNAKGYLAKTNNYLKREERKEKRKADINYARGMKLKRGRKYEAALDLFLLVEKQDPDNANVGTQIGECREKLAGKYDQVVALAEKQFKRKQYQKAYRTCLRAKKINPLGLKQFTLMDNIKSALEQKASPYSDRAEKYYSADKFKKAKSELLTVLTINPWDEDSKELLKKCNRMIALDAEYQAAIGYYNKKNYVAAYGRFRAINKKESGYKSTNKYLDKTKESLNRNASRYYRSGLRYYDSGKYQAAINEMNKVLLANPGHGKAQEYKQRAKAKLATRRSLGGR